MTARIEARALSKRYGANGDAVTAVSDVSFEIAAGEFVAVTGHSGSGKTTLLSLLGGLARPTAGQILFDGEDLAGLDAAALARHRSRRVGFVFQFASLLPALTALENLVLPERFRPDRRPPGEVEARALELLGMVGLGDRAGAFPAELSGGQQRRVAIARAFVNDPEVILADEPTGDLDEETEDEVMRFFRGVNERCGTTFVLVTHDGDVARRAGRRLRMEHGRLRHG